MNNKDHISSTLSGDLWQRSGKKASGFWTRGGHSTVKNTGGAAGSIVWGLRFWLEKIFWGSSKILI